MLQVEIYKGDGDQPRRNLFQSNETLPVLHHRRDKLIALHQGVVDVNQFVLGEIALAHRRGILAVCIGFAGLVLEDAECGVEVKYGGNGRLCIT